MRRDWRLRHAAIRRPDGWAVHRDVRHEPSRRSNAHEGVAEGEQNAVKAGDVILFDKYTSQETKLDGEEYLIMREDEGLAVIETG
jgi:hypothetical protein